MANKSRLARLYAIAGGARVIQYRDKKHTAEKRMQQAKDLAALCRQHGALFIVNDDVELAKQVRADGVHLGREDVSLAQARTQLGPPAIIRVSFSNKLPPP